jgi:hypothetical protein
MSSFPSRAELLWVDRILGNGKLDRYREVRRVGSHLLLPGTHELIAEKQSAAVWIAHTGGASHWARFDGFKASLEAEKRQLDEPVRQRREYQRDEKCAGTRRNPGRDD